jgi:hypothetical protein
LNFIKNVEETPWQWKESIIMAVYKKVPPVTNYEGIQGDVEV